MVVMLKITLQNCAPFPDRSVFGCFLVDNMRKSGFGEPFWDKIDAQIYAEIGFERILKNDVKIDLEMIE